MRRPLVAALPVALFPAVSASACSEGAASESDDPTPATGTETATDATPVSQSSSGEISADGYDPSIFDESSITIDDEWTSFAPGKRFFWRGWTEEEKGERIPHRIVFTVTDLTKVIDGVQTVVGWDRDYSAGKLVETELIFLAQDKSGNLWHFGQYSETFEDVEFVGGQAWLVGHLGGAKAGIYMKAEPRTGTPAYSKGFAPAPFFWDDWGQVYKAGQRTCVPVGCYEDVLVIDSSSRGNRALINSSTTCAASETFERGGGARTRTGRSCPREDRAAQPRSPGARRARALELETRARAYGSTPPAKLRPEAAAG